MGPETVVSSPFQKVSHGYSISNVFSLKCEKSLVDEWNWTLNPFDFDFISANIPNFIVQTDFEIRIRLV